MSTEEQPKLANTSVRAGVIASNDATAQVMAPSPVETSSANELSSASVATVGNVLREAREKLGLSPADIANRLRMGLKQVNALENADYAVLPTGTFLRGFVRNYAKAVALNGDEVVTLLEKTHRNAAAVNASDEVVPNQQNIKVPALGGELATPKWRLIGVGLILLLLVAAGWYWWEYVLPHRSEGGRAANVTNTPLVVLPPPVPVTREVSSAQLDSVATVASMAVSDQPPVEAPSLVVAANASTVVEPLSRAAPPVAPPAVVTSRAKEDDRETSAARERTAAMASAGGAALGFTFSGESWVEVTDASGKKVLSRRFKAGDAEEVLGRAPFTVTIGNASSTRMAFNGREFALDPHIRGAVARVVVK